MTKLMVLSASAVTVAGAALAGFGTGVASAQDVVGMTYADASSEISNSGKTPVLGTVVGDKLPIDECFVVSTTTPVFIDQGGSARDGEVRLNVSCYPAPASAVSPGFSSANNGPDAKAVRDAVEQQQAESEAGVTDENER